MSSIEQQKIIPGSVGIERIDLINFNNETVRIEQLVSEINIIESINSMFCIYEFTVIDGVALLEKFGITGNEKIKLELSKIDTEGGTQVKTSKNLVVTRINRYARVVNQSQGYVIQAVSETAMASAIQRISKSVNGTITKIVQDLYNEISDDNLPLEIRNATSEGNYKIVLPNYTYTDTFSFLLNRAQNTSGTTFHLFETLWGNEVLTTYEQILQQESVDLYSLSAWTDDKESELNTKSSFDAIRTKIKRIESNLGVSNYDAYKNGGISSRVFVNDIATKTLSHTDYFLLQQSLARIDKEPFLSENYSVAGRPAEEYNQSKTFMVNKNTMAYENGDNLQNKVDETIALKRFHNESQFALSHNIVVVGDSRLQAGSTIDVLLPTPTDPVKLSEYRDEYFSGKYFVSEVRHQIFFGGAYTVDMTIRKDSTDRRKMQDKYRNLD